MVRIRFGTGRSFKSLESREQVSSCSTNRVELMETPFENMDPRYMRGVIDALELINSFLAWKAEHPESNRTIKDFLNQALSKLEEKTESKLDEILGLELDE